MVRKFDPAMTSASLLPPDAPEDNKSRIRREIAEQAARTAERMEQDATAPNGSFGELLGANIRGTWDTLGNIAGHFTPTGRAQRARDEGAVAAGWKFDPKVVRELSEAGREYVLENGTSGPEALRDALAHVPHEDAQNEIRAQHGFWANLTAGIISEAANPVQWGASLVTGGASVAARGLFAGAKGGLQAGLLAARTAPKATLAGHITYDVAQGLIAGTVQDTLGGEVRGVTDTAMDVAGAVVFNAIPYVARLGHSRWQGTRGALGALAHEPGNGSLVDNLRAGDLEPPVGTPPVQGEKTFSKVATGEATAGSTAHPKEGSLYDDAGRKYLEGEDIEPPKPTEAPKPVEPPLPTEAPRPPETAPSREAEGIPVGQVNEPDLTPFVAKPAPAGATADPTTNLSGNGSGTLTIEKVHSTVKSLLEDATGKSGATMALFGRQEIDTKLVKETQLRDPLDLSKAEAEAHASNLAAYADGAVTFKRLAESKGTDGVVTIVHEPNDAKVANAEAAGYTGILKGLVKAYLPAGEVVRLVVAPVLSNNAKVNGNAWGGRGFLYMGLREGLGLPGNRTLAHEFGHLLLNVYGSVLTDTEWGKLSDAFRAFTTTADDTDRALRRWAAGSPRQGQVQYAPGKAGNISDKYIADMAEFTAEQFVKFLQKNGEAAGIPPTFADQLKKMLKVLTDFFTDAKQQKLLDPETAYEDFFQAILDGKFKNRAPRETGGMLNPTTQGPMAPEGIEPAFSMDNYVSRRVVGASRIQAQSRLRQGLADGAARFMELNPIKTERLRTINDKVGGALSSGLHMAGSLNTTVQYLASKLVETTTGAAGRADTAAVGWKIEHERVMGRMVKDYNGAWAQWANENNVPWKDRIGVSDARKQFDDAVSVEMLRRRNEVDGDDLQPLSIKRAADTLDALGQRAVDGAHKANIIGVKHLPEKSRGYFTQKLDGRKLAEATHDELETLRDAMGSHFTETYGLQDPKAGRAMAEVYIGRARDRAVGNGSGVAIDEGGSILRNAREEMENLLSGINDPELRQKLSDHAEGMSSTRRKLDVPLEDPAIRRFYSTDLEQLSRGYAHRMAAEVATTNVGMLGFKGVQEIRNTALTHGAPVTRDELRAMDQTIAELFGHPVADAVTSTTASNIRAMTSAVRLGGAVFAQAAETVNVATHLGTASALQFIPALPRLIADLSRRKTGADSKGILAGLDAWGSRIGMRDYDIEMPMTAPEDALRSYTDQPGITTTLIRHISHASQGLNFFRGFLSVQHSYVAEELVKHIGALHVNGGKVTPWMADMGLTDGVVSRLGPALTVIDGRIRGFDPAKLSPGDAQTVVQSIHRGVGQMIQSNFIGEHNAWAHNDWLKVMTQFRTFSITGVEKQWARQRGVAAEAGGALNGYAYLGGALAAQTAVASLIYTGKTHAQSIGLSDEQRKKKMDAAFKWPAMTSGVLNMMTLTGYAGDLWSGLSGLKGWLPESVGEGSSGRGARPATLTEAIPAVGVLNQAGRVASGTTKDWDYELAKVLPGGNSPLVLPFVNMFKD